MVRDSQLKATDLWLMPEDEVLLGQNISEVFPEAAWRCSQPGPPGLHQVHLHPTLPAALACGPHGGGVQAFLHLPVGCALPDGVVPAGGVRIPTGPELGASVQFLRSTMVELGDAHFRSGRLAVRWFKSGVAPAMHDLLTQQTRTIWTAMRAATSVAHVEDAHGNGVVGLRIGPTARAAVLRERIPMGRLGAHRFRLVDTRRN